LIGGEKECVQTLGNHAQQQYSAIGTTYMTTPFFVPEEAHEEDEADHRLNKKPDSGVASETEWEEHQGDQEETREEGREVSPE
jgi:hypothetical protein